MINPYNLSTVFHLGDDCGVLLEAHRVISPSTGFFALHLRIAELDNVPGFDIPSAARLLWPALRDFQEQDEPAPAARGEI